MKSSEGKEFFQWLEQNRLNAVQMLFFLLSMGDFCTRTRNLGALPVLLAAAGRTGQAAKLGEISVSEQQHCTSYAAMAIELLRQSGHPLVDVFAQNNAICEQLFQSLGGVDDPEVLELSRATAELAESTYAPIFRARNTGYRGASYALGVTLEVERVADEVIIPGEIGAFGPNGPYGLSLDHPSMFYIKEHASEIDGREADGAEGWHHTFMSEMYASLAGEERLEADLGQREASATIERWFSLLWQELAARGATNE